MKKLPALFWPALLIVVATAYYSPAFAQPVEAPTQPVTPVTTPAAAGTPEATKPMPNVPANQAMPVQQMPSPASPDNVQDQVLWGLIVSYGLQYLKKVKWFGLVNDDSDGRLKAQLGFVSAFLTATGIHIAVGGNLLEHAGATVTITGLSLDVFKDVVFQWAAQQAWYDGLVRRIRMPVTA